MRLATPRAAEAEYCESSRSEKSRSRPSLPPLVKRLELAIQASIADRQSFIASFSQRSEAVKRANTLLAFSDRKIASLETQLGITECKHKGRPRRPLRG
jgi:hypothetical protein